MFLRFSDPGSAQGVSQEGNLARLLAEAVQLLGRQPGFEWGCVARSPDEPQRWVVAVRWSGAGAMRRGLGAYEVRMLLGSLQRFEEPGSGAYEILGEQGTGEYLTGPSDRDPGERTAGPGRER